MKFVRVFISYMVKYLVSFACVLGCSVLIFIAAQENIEKYVISHTEMKIQEGVQLVERTAERIDMINQTLYSTDEFQRLVFVNGELPRDHVLRLVKCRDLLKQFVSIMDEVPFVFVLFQNNDLFISNTQCSLSFVDHYKNFLDLSFADQEKSDVSALKELLSAGKSKQSFRKLQSITYENSGMKTLENALLYQSETQGELYRLPYTFYAVIPRDFLVDAFLMKNHVPDGFLIVEDAATGEVLVSCGAVPGDGGKSGEGGYIALQETSNKLDWKVTVGVPQTYIRRQISGVRSLMIAYLVLGLVVVIGLALYFSLVRYFGMKRVFSSFSEEVKTESRGFNEYTLLSQSVVKLDARKKEYQLQVEVLREKNRTVLLEKILTRGIQTPQEKQFFVEYFGHIPEQYCMVVVRFSGSDMAGREAVTMEMITAFLEKNVQLLENIRNDTNDEVFLVELPSGDPNCIAQLQDTLREIINPMGSKAGISLHIGISDVETELRNMGRCYDQANRMVQALYLYENESMIQVFDTKTYSQQENAVSNEFLGRLYTVLICGQMEEIRQELEQIEAVYRTNPHGFERHKERIFWSIYNVFYTVMLRVNCGDWRKHIPAFSPKSNCHDMVAEFTASAQWICTFIDGNKKSKNERLKDKIMACIEQCYTDPGASAYLVSQMAGISEKYLFQFWKEQTGETVATTLMRFRIQKAIEYLEQTDLSNAQIAALVGFASENTFYRNFQKITGVTPKTYRDQLKP